MDKLHPLLRSLNLCVGLSGGSHCFVLCPLMLTHTLSGITDGLLSSFLTLALNLLFCTQVSVYLWFIRCDSSSNSPVPSVYVLGAIELSPFFSLLPPLPFHFAPVLFILPSTVSFFSVGLWVCFILLFFLRVYFYKQKYSMLIIVFISIPFS